MSRGSGGLVYNLWKDAKNPRGLWRRTTLAEFRNAEPAWETLLDIDRLATEEDKDWLLNWTQPLPGNSRVIIAPFARRQRRGDAAGIRSGHQGFRRRRIHPAGSQERRRMGRRRHAAAFERPWRGHGDDFRLCENRPAVAPRRARANGRRCCSKCRPIGWPRTAASTTPAPTPRMWFIDRIDFFNHNLWLGDRGRSDARSSTCRPTSGWKRITTGWP